MPEGLAEKVELTGRFLRRKMQEYEVLRGNRSIENEVDDSVVNNIRKFMR